MKNRATYQFLVIFIFFLCSCTKKERIQRKISIDPAIQIPEEKNQPNSLYKPSNILDHIPYIRQNSKIGQLDGVEHNPKYFIDYTIEELLESNSHKKYITDRKLLRRLRNDVCWDNYVSIKDTLLNGDKIEIEIEAQDFDTINRTIIHHDKSNYLLSIDGEYPFGAVYSKQPSKEIESLTIKINERQLQTSLYKYKNLYEPQFCNFGSYQRITEAYEDADNIYIYLFGGNAADSYFAKLIFDKTNGYITSIIADYGPLSSYGCFGEHFIGF